MVLQKHIQEEKPTIKALCRMFSIPDEVLMVIFSEGSIFSKLDQQK